MPHLVLEVGCEELPPTSISPAAQQMGELVATGLAEAGLGGGAPRIYATPRRLILGMDGIADRQDDRTEEKRGPKESAAYGEDGAPTRALEGFCKGAGIEPSEVTMRDGYCYAEIKIEGRPAAAVAAEVIAEAIGKIEFAKTMRWGRGSFRFARPIRWMVACLDGEVIPLKVAEVAAGKESRGHRFDHPEPFEVNDLDGLLKDLRERKVEPDPEVRIDRIRKGAEEASGGQAVLDDALVAENAFLTEWPTALLGEFDPEFLVLPEPVLITAMAHHERFFPVREDGKITNRFVSISNGGDPETVRAGNAWVLNARFNDALFFYQEDQGVTMDEFLERTSGISHQAGLGTVRQRADRLESIATLLAEQSADEVPEILYSAVAARLAKADLSCGLVSELPKLQGVIGGEYARRDGLPDQVCNAIALHYLAPTAKQLAESADRRTAARVLLADQIDRLAGNLGIGNEPKGSSDPYALRRAANLIIETAWAWPKGLPSFYDAFQHALKLHQEQGIEVDPDGALERAVSVFISRYEHLFGQQGAAHDRIEAAVSRMYAPDVFDPRLVRLRLATVQRLAGDPSFVEAATRPVNIVDAARKKGITVNLDAGKLDSADGEALFAASARALESAIEALQAEDVEALSAILLTLPDKIEAFFESTMVMAENEEVRAARLGVADLAGRVISAAGDFTKIVS